jgi:hypothetical protein
MTDLVNQIIGDALEGRSELCKNGSVSKARYSRRRTNPPRTRRPKRNPRLNGL